MVLMALSYSNDVVRFVLRRWSWSLTPVTYDQDVASVSRIPPDT